MSSGPKRRRGSSSCSWATTSPRARTSSSPGRASTAHGWMSSAEEHFAEAPLALEVYTRVAELIEDLGGAEVTVSKTQVGFSRRRGFAWVWTPPGRDPATSPAILSIAYSHQIVSDRFRD